MFHRRLLNSLLIVLICSPLVAQSPDRTSLPPVAPEFGGKIGNSYKESTPDFSPALPLNAPKGAATISEVLKQNGYSTLAFGKWHLTPYTAYTATGPFDRWPLGMGFERYYGFIGGETDQWSSLAYLPQGS
ncbi:sulfatase-like hydrolase/transferase [Novipirellula artificiosorum]|uniref:Sulfatase n=1 Tax=Novipirellula artificiosorum TaxID=2528016 RepID=A0A5C6CUD0_9BACT|nr:sulfatase-like hydrolase/transferase [Novipirellula artificiosorum]TWU28028.1 Sulfatase [Novipirellula artificiosorum]